MTINTAMGVNALNSGDLTDLRRALHGGGDRAPKQVAQQFESLFVQTMLKSMRAASMGDGGMFSNAATKQYRQLFDRQMAMEMSRGQGLGLAPMIERQMRARTGDATDAQATLDKSLAGYWRRAPVATPPQQISDALSPQAARADNTPEVESADRVTAPADVGRWRNPRAFIRDILPAAERTASELGVSPRALVAQAALETGWGQRVIRRADGASSFNLFNIKAHGWSGQRVSIPTLEYRDGVAVRESAEFRAYDSVKSAFADYAAFLKANPRYREALQAGSDAGAFVDELERAGYATDPDYAEKLRRILGGATLNDSVTALKNSSEPPKT